LCEIEKKLETMEYEKLSIELSKLCKENWINMYREKWVFYLKNKNYTIYQESLLEYYDFFFVKDIKKPDLKKAIQSVKDYLKIPKSAK
jgi:hypothetical protein